MRLVCPNCEAKYEVPDDAIPDSGRDVQCANCGHAWFQTRSRAVSAITPLTETVEAPAAVAATPGPEMTSDVTAAATVEPAPEPVAETVAAAARKSDKVEKAEPPAPAPEPETPKVEAPAETIDAAPAVPEPEEELAAEVAAPAVDEKVLSILREEAEREAKARRDESRPLESQPDLGIDAAGPRKKAGVKKRETEPAAKPAARRDLLPDVEEINSTLRPSEEPEPEFVGGLPEAELREGRGAFRAGFLLVISFAILGASIYITSDWIAARVPALAGLLAAYVSLIDALRLGLDGLMRSATQLISGDKG